MATGGIMTGAEQGQGLAGPVPPSKVIDQRLLGLHLGDVASLPGSFIAFGIELWVGFLGPTPLQKAFRGREIAQPNIEPVAPNATRPAPHRQNARAVFRSGGYTTVFGNQERQIVQIHH